MNPADFSMVCFVPVYLFVFKNSTHNFEMPPIVRRTINPHNILCTKSSETVTISQRVYLSNCLPLRQRTPATLHHYKNRSDRSKKRDALMLAYHIYASFWWIRIISALHKWQGAKNKTNLSGTWWTETVQIGAWLWEHFSPSRRQKCRSSYQNSSKILPRASIF